MPAVTLTREELTAMNPCGLDGRLALFGRRRKMDVRQALAAGATVSNILWVAGRLGLGKECAHFAEAAAKRVAHLQNSAAYAASASDAAADAAAYASADAAAYASAAYAACAAYAADYAADYAAAAAAAYAAADAAAEREAQKQILIEVFG